MTTPVNVTEKDTIEQWRVKSNNIGTDLSNAYQVVANVDMQQSQEDFNLQLALSGTRWN